MVRYGINPVLEKWSLSKSSAQNIAHVRFFKLIRAWIEWFYHIYNWSVQLRCVAMITHLINYVVLGLLEFNPQMTLKPINYANNSCIKKRHLELDVSLKDRPQ